jgi:hypothetical protein
MKLIALAAALAVGGTAIAQDMPAQTTETAQPAEPATPPPAVAPDDSVTTGAGETPAAPAPAPSTATPDPQGGYASTPTVSGTPQPGAPVVFAPSPTPAEAFPAPAPLESYPICKKGQFDDCMQRGG